MRGDAGGIGSWTGEVALPTSRTLCARGRQFAQAEQGQSLHHDFIERPLDRQQVCAWEHRLGRAGQLRDQ